MGKVRVLGLVVLLLGLGGAVAFAEQLTGDAAPYWSTAEALAANTTECFPTDSSTTTCALFPATLATWKRLNSNRIMASAEAVCCWGLTSGLDIDIASMEYAASNKGPCFLVPASPAVVFTRPSYKDLLEQGGGSVTGICASPANSIIRGGAGDTLIYPACDADADCVAHGLTGGCTAAASVTQAQRDNVGAYLNCESSGTPTIYVTKERIQSWGG
jgi:hypothetical protein